MQVQVHVCTFILLMVPTLIIDGCEELINISSYINLLIKRRYIDVLIEIWCRHHYELHHYTSDNILGGNYKRYVIQDI